DVRDAVHRRGAVADVPPAPGVTHGTRPAPRGAGHVPVRVPDRRAPHAPGAAPHPANAEGRDPDSPGSRPSALRTSDSRSVADHTPHGRVDGPSTRAGPRVVTPGAPPRTLPTGTPYSWPRGPSVVVLVAEEAAHRGGGLAHGARTLRTHRRHRLGHRRLHLLL